MQLGADLTNFWKINLLNIFAREGGELAQWLAHLPSVMSDRGSKVGIPQTKFMFFWEVASQSQLIVCPSEWTRSVKKYKDCMSTIVHAHETCVMFYSCRALSWILMRYLKWTKNVENSPQIVFQPFFGCGQYLKLVKIHNRCPTLINDIQWLTTSRELITEKGHMKVWFHLLSFNCTGIWNTVFLYKGHLMPTH